MELQQLLKEIGKYIFNKTFQTLIRLLRRKNKEKQLPAQTVTPSVTVEKERSDQTTT